MKKIWMGSMLILVSLGLSTPVQAEPKQGESVKRVYVTSEEIFFDMLRPTITKYVTDHYGHEIVWFEPRIVDARSEVTSNNWTYEVALMIKVDDHLDKYEGYGLDILKLKIDSTRNKNKRPSESNIRLLEYRNVVLPQQLNR
ncbi:DUF3888 domain-containing protein [Cohnella sp. GbtcB17]|uniref:DUF3888 domain-containing protein n=1 Tax=Cohnella sp. GbtcB17 TaxID=2824762 RepID=UPI001C3050D4|nr:DUF3888 domain-containing protein [Cohnella sp. GbtcB17]